MRLSGSPGLVKLKIERFDMKLRQIGLAVLFVSGLAASGLASAGNADFTLVNKTGYAIREVYLSPAHKTKWGNDRLGTIRSTIISSDCSSSPIRQAANRT